MAELEELDGGVILSRAHILISPPDKRILSRKNLGVIAGRLLEDIGYDFVIIHGAVRTTGARPGHRPRELRFSRGDRPAAEPSFP
ncbi:hypothetical protein [Paracoccus versutus]|uniref:hypothetical protein n=1 Tax=Paracoccus versutus TaxID=34007 RepID=UPI0015F0A9D3|nr:hypothetical protein [Paracoccus versutus]